MAKKSALIIATASLNSVANKNLLPYRELLFLLFCFGFFLGFLLSFFLIRSENRIGNAHVLIYIFKQIIPSIKWINKNCLST